MTRFRPRAGHRPLRRSRDAEPPLPRWTRRHHSSGIAASLPIRRHRYPSAELLAISSSRSRRRDRFITWSCGESRDPRRLRTTGSLIGPGPPITTPASRSGFKHRAGRLQHAGRVHRIGRRPEAPFPAYAFPRLPGALEETLQYEAPVAPARARSRYASRRLAEISASLPNRHRIEAAATRNRCPSPPRDRSCDIGDALRISWAARNETRSVKVESSGAFMKYSGGHAYPSLAMQVRHAGFSSRIPRARSSSPLRRAWLGRVMTPSRRTSTGRLVSVDSVRQNNFHARSLAPKITMTVRQL